MNANKKQKKKSLKLIIPPIYLISDLTNQLERSKSNNNKAFRNQTAGVFFWLARFTLTFS